MSDSIETTINTPSTPPPHTPHPDERNINDPGEPVGQVAFDMKVSEIEAKMAAINKRIDLSYALMIGLLVVLAICFITLFYGYWQFAATSYNDYTQKSKELNDDRYNLLQEKMNFLESKISTQSGR